MQQFSENCKECLRGILATLNRESTQHKCQGHSDPLLGSNIQSPHSGVDFLSPGMPRATEFPDRDTIPQIEIGLVHGNTSGYKVWANMFSTVLF